MKKRFLSLLLAIQMLLLCQPAIVSMAEQPAKPEYAWILTTDIKDYENAEKWQVADAHKEYAVQHSYSRGVYTASTTYEGDDPYDQGRKGTFAVMAVFSGVPSIIYPGEPVSLKLSFVPTEDSVVALSFTAYASANFDRWDVPPGGGTGSAIPFKNADGEDSFKIVAQNSKSYDEILTATLGSGTENSRIALRLGFYMGVSMGTNYVYEWKKTEGYSAYQGSLTASAPPNSPSPTPRVEVIRVEFPPLDDPEWETYKNSPSIVKFGDLHGEVNVKRYGEDDDAYIFAELDTPLHHGLVIRTRRRSGAILSFSDMSTFVVKENTIIVLDIKNEKESKIALLAGTVWTNLKKMVNGDGSLEIEMSQGVAGIKGTILAASVSDAGEEVFLFTSSAEVTSKENGKTVTLKPGQMALINQTGDIQVEKFDIASQAKEFDISMSDLKADGYKEGQSSGLIWILLVLAAVIVAIIVTLLLRKNRMRTLVAQSTTGISAGSYSQAITKSIPQNSYCPNCGKPINDGQRFCQHCGKDVSKG